MEQLLNHDHYTQAALDVLKEVALDEATDNATRIAAATELLNRGLVQEEDARAQSWQAAAERAAKAAPDAA